MWRRQWYLALVLCLLGIGTGQVAQADVPTEPVDIPSLVPLEVLVDTRSGSNSDPSNPLVVNCITTDGFAQEAHVTFTKLFVYRAPTAVALYFKPDDGFGNRFVWITNVESSESTCVPTHKPVALNAGTQYVIGIASGMVCEPPEGVCEIARQGGTGTLVFAAAPPPVRARLTGVRSGVDARTGQAVLRGRIRCTQLAAFRVISQIVQSRKSTAEEVVQNVVNRDTEPCGPTFTRWRAYGIDPSEFLQPGAASLHLGLVVFADLSTFERTIQRRVHLRPVASNSSP